MKKIATIVNETPDFVFTGEGCTPCECGDSIACIQEQYPFLESVPSNVLAYILLFVLLGLVLLIVVFASKIFYTAIATIRSKK